MPWLDERVGRWILILKRCRNFRSQLSENRVQLLIMTRDFANKPRRQNRRSGYQSRVPAWVWLFTGSVLGAFVMFLVYLTGVPSQPSQFPELTLSESPTEPPKPSVETVEPAQPSPRFDFYQLLEKRDITKVEPPDSSITPVHTGVKYTLQAGSFRDPANADRLRAELILLNLEARVETVTARNADTLHLVIVGPFTTQAQLAKARGTLAARDIDSLVLKQNSVQQEG